MAWRTARVTLARARSEAEPARRSRPPRPTARASSRTRKSRSASACAARSSSPMACASSMSSSISASRRRYASLACASSSTPASRPDENARPGSDAAVDHRRTSLARRRPGRARGTRAQGRRAGARGSAGPSGPAAAPSAPRTPPTSSHPRGERRSHRRVRAASPDAHAAALSALAGSSRPASPHGRAASAAWSHGSDPLEARPGGLELQDRALLVALGAVRAARAPCARAPSRRARRSRSRGARPLRTHGVRRAVSPSASATRSAGERRAGGERLAFEQRGDRARARLPPSRAPFEVAGRDLDLDLRLEQGRPAELRVRRQLLGRDVRAGARARLGWTAPPRATSPLARCTRARPGCGSQPTSCAARNASSAPWMSPRRSRMRPSSVNGHPNSRRR